jgi:hypothetical protein
MWRLLTQGLARPMPVVVAEVLAQHHPQVPADDQEPVSALTAPFLPTAPRTRSPGEPAAGSSRLHARVGQDGGGLLPGSPWPAARSAGGPPPVPRSDLGDDADMSAPPTAGPARYAHHEVQSLSTRTTPSDRAGFTEAPLTGAPPQPGKRAAGADGSERPELVRA